MKTTIYSFCFLIFATIFTVQLTAQTTLNGYVKLRNSGNKTLSEVSILADAANNRGSVSRSDGSFELIFPSKKMGETVVLNPQKDGHETVNETDLERPLGFDKVKIIMARSEDLDEEKKTFYNVSFRRERELKDQSRRLEKQINNLSADAANDRKRLTDSIQILQNVLKYLPQNREDMLARLQKIDLDECTETERRIYEATKNGQSNSLFFYGNVKFGEVTRRQKTIQKERKKLRDDSEILKNVAHFAHLSGYVDSANHFFRAAVFADESNISAFYDYAAFLWRQNRLDSARIFVQKAINLATDSAKIAPSVFRYEKQLADALDLSSRIAFSARQFDAADSSARASVAIFDNILRRNSSVFTRIKYARALRNYGNICIKIGDDAAARRQFNIADGVLQSVAASDSLQGKHPLFYLNEVADLYESWGNWTANQISTPNFERAADYHERALEARRRIWADKKADADRAQNVALSLQSLALVRQKNRQFDAAEAAFLENVQIFDTLAVKNPEAYEPDLARSFANVAQFYADNKQFTKADKFFERVARFYERLAAEKPTIYGQKLFEFYLNQAVAQHRKYNGDRADFYFVRADSVLQILPNSADFDALKRRVHFDFLRGNAFLLRGQNDQATACFRQIVATVGAPNVASKLAKMDLQVATFLRLSACFRANFLKNKTKTDRDWATTWLNLAKKNYADSLDAGNFKGNLKKSMDEETAFWQSLKTQDWTALRQISALQNQIWQTPEATRRANLLQNIWAQSRSMWQKDPTNAYKKWLFTEGVGDFAEALIEAADFGRAEKICLDARQMFGSEQSDWSKKQAHATLLQGRIAVALPMYAALFAQNNRSLNDEIKSDLARFVADKWLKIGEREQVLKKLKMQN